MCNESSGPAIAASTKKTLTQSEGDDLLDIFYVNYSVLHKKICVHDEKRVNEEPC